jgi:hypothetical protein
MSQSKTTAATGTDTAVSTPTGAGNSPTPQPSSAADESNTCEPEVEKMRIHNPESQ